MSNSVSTSKQSGDVRDSIDRLYLLMAAVIIVLLVAFAAGFIAMGSWMTTSNAQKQASYENLQDEVQAQNTKIDSLTREIRSQNEQKTDQIDGQ